MNGEQIILGSHTREALELTLKMAADIRDTGERIQFLSGHLLGTGYGESTLAGSEKTDEVFVIDLGLVDCLTFIEYIEAMRLSSSFSEFITNLKRIRYKSGDVAYQARNHFFTDWKESNSDTIEDVTERVGGKMTVRIQKKLNEKEGGTVFLRGIQPVIRTFSYIPAPSINADVINDIRTGDYIGIYSHVKGLDVSHTGIVVRHDDILFFRHASSQTEHRRVIDQHFKEYIGGKPGIIVFRPKKQK